MRRITVIPALLAFTGVVPLKAQTEWHVRDSGTAKDILSVTYGAGIFLATDGRPLLSYDGIKWTRPSWPGTELINIVTRVDDKFIGFGYDAWNAAGAIFVSADGVNATRISTPLWSSASGDASCLFAAKVGDDILVSCMVNLSTPPYSRGLMRLTPDLKPEAVTTVPANERELIWIYKCDDEVLACYGKTIFASRDGRGWSLRTRREEADLVAPVSLRGRLLSGDCYSDDAGATWTALPDPPPAHSAVVFGGGTLAGVGGAFATTSTDGKVWIQRETGSATNLTTITYGQNTFVAAGENGRIITSHTDDPSPALILPELQIAPSVTLKWQSIQGIHYQPESSSDLKTWLPVGSPIPGSGIGISKTFEITTSCRFFRITAK